MTAAFASFSFAPTFNCNNSTWWRIVGGCLVTILNKFIKKKYVEPVKIIFVINFNKIK